MTISEVSNSQLRGQSFTHSMRNIKLKRINRESFKDRAKEQKLAGQLYRKQEEDKIPLEKKNTFCTFSVKDVQSISSEQSPGILVRKSDKEPETQATVPHKISSTFTKNQIGTIRTILQKKYKLFSDKNSQSSSNHSKDQVYRRSNLNKDLHEANSSFKENNAGRSNAVSFNSFIDNNEMMSEEKNKFVHLQENSYDANRDNSILMLEARKRSNSYSPDIDKKRAQRTRFNENSDVVRSTELIKEKKIEEE